MAGAPRAIDETPAVSARETGFAWRARPVPAQYELRLQLPHGCWAAARPGLRTRLPIPVPVAAGEPHGRAAPGRASACKPAPPGPAVHSPAAGWASGTAAAVAQARSASALPVGA